MISGNRDEAWPMYLAWPIPERFMLGVIRWHVTCMLSLARHWQDRRALSNHVCAHSVIPMWHLVCLQHLAKASSEQSRSTTVLPINHVIQIPQCLSGFVNHDYCLVNSLFRCRSKKTSKLHVTGLCAGNSPHKWPVMRKMFPFDDVINYNCISL